MSTYTTTSLEIEKDTFVNTLPYNLCETAAGTAAKTVSVGDFELITGATVIVKFKNANGAENPTLNVSDTGAKAIYYKGSTIAATGLKENRAYLFVYDGSYWTVVGDVHPDLLNDNQIGKPYDNLTPSFGDEITISAVSANKEGHVVSVIDRSITIPNTLASGTTPGLIKNTITVNNKPAGGIECHVYDGVPYYKDLSYTGIAYCSTAGSTNAKEASMPKFTMSTGQIILLHMISDNTATSGVTLSVGSGAAKAVKISNYTDFSSPANANSSNFKAGNYLAKNDGTNWILYKIHLTDSDHKVRTALGKTTKAYLLGTSQTPTSTSYVEGTTLADTGVYLTTTSGQLHATSFSGSGASLTNLDAGALASGTVPTARLPYTMELSGTTLTITIS